jgi:hypothetical protein
MSPDELRAANFTPSSLSNPLEALRADASGDWEQAHRFVQDDDGADAAWVHAYLHRKEGDLSNARYWYARAGREFFDGPLEDEWAQIATTLLEGP